MTTVYIKGKDKYEKAVRKALRKSKLDEGDHYIEGVNALHQTVLYWITSRITLRDFKKGIGTNIIWKHRLRFYENVEQLLEKADNSLTEKEVRLINKMRNKQIPV
jgi:hypothetical protein